MRKREIEVAKILIKIPKKKLIVIKELLSDDRFIEITVGYRVASGLTINGVETINDFLKYSSDTILNTFFNSHNNYERIEKLIKIYHPKLFLYNYGEGVDYLEIIDAILFTKKELFKLVKKINIENPNEKDRRNLRLLYLKLSIEKI